MRIHVCVQAIVCVRVVIISLTTASPPPPLRTSPTTNQQALTDRTGFSLSDLINIVDEVS